MSLSKFATIILLFLLTASCSQKAADVIYKGDNFYGKHSNGKSSAQKIGKSAGIPALKNRQIIVGKDETLYAISRKYQVPLRDLIKENNLSPPYKVKAGATLTLPTLNYHIVAKGETIYSISRIYNMNINNLISLNNLDSPYELKIGQQLKITKFDQDKTVVANSKKPQNEAVSDSKQQSNSVLKKSSVLVERKLSNKLNNFSWPINNPKIISGFGPKSGGLYNDGVDIAAKEGDPVHAAEEGVVAYVGNELRGYGNLIIVKHANGWITAYAHLSKTNVALGDKITKSQVIAQVGATGNVSKPQLYFGLRKGRDAVNPTNYLR